MRPWAWLRLLGGVECRLSFEVVRLEENKGSDKLELTPSVLLELMQSVLLELMPPDLLKPSVLLELMHSVLLDPSVLKKYEIFTYILLM